MAFKLDFDKLRDPEWQKKVREEREAESALLEARDKELRALVEQCNAYYRQDMAHYEQMPAKDRQLVSNVHHRLNTFGIVSDAQEKWLRDIVNRIPSNA